MIEYSIIIRCCNEVRHIGRLLDAIQRQTLKNVETIIVDSGSTDGTLDVAKQYPVRLLRISSEEFSFGRSLNIGCQAASGKILIFVSAHVYPVGETWLEQLVAPLKNPKVALTYGKQRGNGSTKYSEEQIFRHWFPDESPKDSSYPFCNNANAAIKRELWEEIPYDETLSGLEDLDWAKRAAERKYKVVYVPEAEIIHIHEERWKQVFNRYRREAIALKQIYPTQRFTARDFVGLMLRNMVSDYFHALHDAKFRENILSIAFFRFMQFWGTYRGFTHRGEVGAGLKQIFYYPRRFAPQMGNVKGSRTGDVLTSAQYHHVDKDTIAEGMEHWHRITI